MQPQIGPSRPQIDVSPTIVNRASITTAPAKPPVRDPWGTPPPGYIPGRGRGATGFAGGVSRDDTVADHDRADYSDRNFDEFNGYNEALFQSAEYDEEDRQADITYDSIDVMMDMRGRARRERRLKEELAKLRAEKPTIHQQFADLKQALAGVSREEWEALPDIGDPGLRTKQKRPSRMQRAPDNLLVDAAAKRSGGALGGSLTPMPGGDSVLTPAGGGMDTPLIGYATPTPGLSTPMGMQTPLGLSTPLGLATPMGLATPLGLATPTGLSTPAGVSSTSGTTRLLEGHQSALSSKLDNVMAGSVTGKTSVVDPQGYLTALNSMGHADVTNTAKHRSLLKSIVSTNPNNPNGWIAYARLEQNAGRIGRARDIIAEACSKCPQEEEVWMEAAKMHSPEDAKTYLTVAVGKFLPTSVRLWVELASRESDADAKRRTLRKGLERISNSVRLWQEAVALENEQNARLLLLRAVECVPQSVELWLKLASVSEHKDARRALNEARKNCPASTEIWVAAAELEESRRGAQEENLRNMLRNGLNKLKADDVVFDRSVWVNHAEEVEERGNVATCRAIIMAISIYDEDTPDKKSLKHARLEEAEQSLAKNRPETARAILESCTELMPTKKSLWLALIDLESRFPASKDKVQTLRKKACEAMPNKELFWLMLAKGQWMSGQTDDARATLAAAMEQADDKEAIALAAVKIERETGNISEARRLLKEARERLGEAAIWMQSVQLERQVGNYQDARELVNTALEKHPKHAKLWLISAALELEKGTSPDFSAASNIYEQGLRHLPKSTPLWVCAIDCKTKQGRFSQARALREKANICVPKDELVWFKAVEIEKADPLSSEGTARHVMNKALQECPKSGILWGESVWLQEPSARAARAVEAISATENDPYCVLVAARLFWADRKERKAREWFKKASELDSRLGDAYGEWLAFELQQKDKKKLAASITEAASRSEPNRGYRWNRCQKKVTNWGMTIRQKLIAYVLEYYPEFHKEVHDLGEKDE